MVPEEFKRKLTAILSADVEGYSALMRDDEEATVRTLNMYKEMMFVKIPPHNGHPCRPANCSPCRAHD
jgi:hypothetical protein